MAHRDADGRSPDRRRARPARRWRGQLRDLAACPAVRGRRRPARGSPWARLRGREAWTRQHLDRQRRRVAGRTARASRSSTSPSTWQTRQRTGRRRARPTGGDRVDRARRAGAGFPVASPVEQDGLVGSWGAVARSDRAGPLSDRRVTWQEWSHPVGVAGHAGSSPRPVATASTSRRTPTTNGLLDQVGPFTIAHDVHLTVTVDLRRVRSRRGASTFDVAMEVLVDECRQLATRLEAGGYAVDAPLTGAALATGVRLRSDPTRGSGSVARLAGERGGSDGRGVGSDGGRAGLVRVPRRRVVASVVSGRRVADAAGRRGLDGAAADGRRRDPDGDGRARAGAARVRRRRTRTVS